MSIIDDALSNTVGVVWRAASGTVDPWTKNVLIEDAANAQVQASGGTISPDQAKEQAATDVTNVLVTFGDGQGADPSQVLQGVKNSLNLAADIGTNIGKTALYLGIGVALVYGVIFLVQSGTLRRRA